MMVAILSFGCCCYCPVNRGLYHYVFLHQFYPQTELHWQPESPGLSSSFGDYSGSAVTPRQQVGPG